MTAWAKRNSNKRSKASKFPQWKWQLTEFLQQTENRIVIPTSVLGTPHLQLDTEELSINYGTLGVSLASSILSWALAGRPEGPLLSRDGPQLARVRLCVQSIAETLSLDAATAEETRMDEFLWAVKVAHKYIEAGGVDVDGIQSWLFFMRLCRTMCHKDTENARLAELRCNYATFVSPGFDRAFNCSRQRLSGCK